MSKYFPVTYPPFYTCAPCKCEISHILAKINFNIWVILIIPAAHVLRRSSTNLLNDSPKNQMALSSSILLDIRNIDVLIKAPNVNHPGGFVNMSAKLVSERICWNPTLFSAMVSLTQ